jgi:RNA polymerase sigma-70 factor, ECF subfamily
MNQVIDDQTIIDRITKGDKDAYAHLVKRYQQKVYQTCMGFLHDEDDAADLTQEIFIKVYEKLPSFKGKATFSTWLYRISMNMAINVTRKQRLRSLFQRLGQNNEPLQVPGGTNADQKMLRTEQKHIIQQALSKLTSSQRKAFVLSHYRDLNNNELAEVMEISLKAAESLLFRARTKLQEEFKKAIKNTQS